MADSFPDRAQAFFLFLHKQARQAQALYLLGDLFDRWPGDDDDDETATETRRELSALVAAGIGVYVQRGNRDFLLGKRFARDTGCTLIGDTHVLTVGERRLLLMHGDTLCDDKAHKRYRLGRSLLIPALAAFMPLARRRNLAAWMQEQSSSSRQPVKISKQTAIFSLRQNRCQTLIHGHLHAPGEETWQDGKDTFIRICLSDWESKGGYVKINTINGEISNQTATITT